MRRFAFLGHRLLTVFRSEQPCNVALCGRGRAGYSAMCREHTDQALAGSL